MSQEETRESDAPAPEMASGSQYWLSLIDRAKRTPGFDKWNRRCEKIKKRYRYEQSSDTKTRRYQLLWSTMQTMAPAVYSRPPKPVVSRRWKDKDATARTAAQMLERCVEFQLELNGWHDRFLTVRDDFLLFARGVVRLRYEPVFDTLEDESAEPDMVAMRGPEAEAQEDGEDASQEPQEVLQFENVHIDFLQREDFVHSPARTWQEVDWVAFRAFMTRDALVERFGEDVGNQVALDASPMNEDGKPPSSEEDPADQKAAVWEVWHRPSKRVLWVAAGYDKVLEEGAPYLKLEGFFPCPKPAYGTLTSDSLDPVPDYVYYQDQAEEIDQLTARIGHLTDQLKIVGLYPSGASDTSQAIQKMAATGVENVMIPVPNWAQFKEGGGARGSIEWWPVEQVITVLEGSVKLRQQLIDDVNQIIGISDIMRGDGNAQETATAQSIKAQYGSVRIRERQGELARFCADVARMAAEIICHHFQPATLMQMANMPLPTRQDVEMAQQQAAVQAQMQQRQAMAAQPQQPAQPGPMGA